jgi:hypothetical protein
MLKDYEKAGVDPKEVTALGQAVLATLKAGPLTTDALRKALPAGAARSLGEAGKKIGMSSTLPSALRELEFNGQIERTLEGGRVDSDRYLWRATAANPFDGADVPEEPTARHARLLEIFLRAAGPATLKDFAAWSGLAQKDAKAAAARLKLVSVEVDGYAKDAVALDDALDTSKPTGLALLSFEDNLTNLHGGPGLMLDPKHHPIQVPLWGPGKDNTLGGAKHILIRTILVGDRLAGMWEYDAAKGELAIAALKPLPAGIQQLAAETAAFLRDEIGHGRSFGLDTDKDVAERAAFVRRQHA